MAVIKFILRMLGKFFGIFSFLIYLRPKFYYENKFKKEGPGKGACIICSNHTSIMDYFTILLRFWYRKVVTLVAETIYRFPVLGFFNNMMDNILVKRNSADMNFMVKSENVLKKGGCLLIFPEGHLMHNGEIDEFKPSVVYLALRTGAPIILNYIEGHYMPFWKRTRVITSEKIYLKDYCDTTNPTPEQVRELCEILRQRTLKLKRKMFLYRKHDTYNTLSFRYWFLDFAKGILLPFQNIVFPVKKHYVGNCSKQDFKIKGEGIIASKHSSFFDPPILAMHYFSRRVHTIIGEDLYCTHPWLFKSLAAINYRRVNNSADPKCFMEVVNILTAEGVVGIYPEGHIIKDGLGTIHEGVAYFSLTTNSPIYFYIMMKPYKPFRRNHLMIGETIYPDKIFDKNNLKTKENIEKLTDMIQGRFNHVYSQGLKYIQNK